jgi:transposase InsO family protein
MLRGEEDFLKVCILVAKTMKTLKVSDESDLEGAANVAKETSSAKKYFSMYSPLLHAYNPHYIGQSLFIDDKKSSNLAKLIDAALYVKDYVNLNSFKLLNFNNDKDKANAFKLATFGHKAWLTEGKTKIFQFLDANCSEDVLRGLRATTDLWQSKDGVGLLQHLNEVYYNASSEVRLLELVGELRAIHQGQRSLSAFATSIKTLSNNFIEAGIELPDRLWMVIYMAGIDPKYSTTKQIVLQKMDTKGRSTTPGAIRTLDGLITAMSKADPGQFSQPLAAAAATRLQGLKPRIGKSFVPEDAIFTLERGTFKLFAQAPGQATRPMCARCAQYGHFAHTCRFDTSNYSDFSKPLKHINPNGNKGKKFKKKGGDDKKEGAEGENISKKKKKKKIANSARLTNAAVGTSSSATAMCSLLVGQCLASGAKSCGTHILTARFNDHKSLLVEKGSQTSILSTLMSCYNHVIARDATKIKDSYPFVYTGDSKEFVPKTALNAHLALNFPVWNDPKFQGGHMGPIIPARVVHSPITKKRKVESVNHLTDSEIREIESKLKKKPLNVTLYNSESDEDPLDDIKSLGVNCNEHSTPNESEDDEHSSEYSVRHMCCIVTKSMKNQSTKTQLVQLMCLFFKAFSSFAYLVQLAFMKLTLFLYICTSVDGQEVNPDIKSNVMDALIGWIPVAAAVFIVAAAILHYTSYPYIVNPSAISGELHCLPARFGEKHKRAPNKHAFSARQTDTGGLYRVIQACIDSGAAAHFFSCPAYLFTNFRALSRANSPVIIVGNGQTVAATGKGSIGTFNNVFHVPEMEMNLLSVSELTKEGYEIQFNSNSCCLHRNGEITHSVAAVNGIYNLPIKIPVDLDSQGLAQASAILKEKPYVFSNVASFNKAVLWHCRLGHINYQSLKKMNQKFNLRIPWSHFKTRSLCETCLATKSTKLSAPKSRTSARSTKPFQLISSDICGPFATQSDEGHLHFTVFVDDFSRMVWVYPMCRKSELFNVFRTFIGTVVRPNSGQIECIHNLRSDNGAEYMSANMTTYCVESGIRQQFTVAGTSSQNGQAERMIRTLVTRMRSLLVFSALHKGLWNYALSCAAYITNRLPTRANNGACPLALFTPSQPLNLDRFRVFGCKCWVHLDSSRRISEEKKAKSDRASETAKDAIFLDYDKQRKGYIVFIVSTGRVRTVWSLRFDESRYPARPVRRQVFENEDIFTLDTELLLDKRYVSPIDAKPVQTQQKTITMPQSGIQLDFPELTQSEVKTKVTSISESKSSNIEAQANHTNSSDLKSSTIINGAYEIEEDVNDVDLEHPTSPPTSTSLFEQNSSKTKLHLVDSSNRVKWANDMWKNAINSKPDSRKSGIIRGNLPQSNKRVRFASKSTSSNSLILKKPKKIVKPVRKPTRHTRNLLLRSSKRTSPYPKRVRRKTGTLAPLWSQNDIPQYAFACINLTLVHSSFPTERISPSFAQAIDSGIVFDDTRDAVTSSSLIALAAPWFGRDNSNISGFVSQSSTSSNSNKNSSNSEEKLSSSSNNDCKSDSKMFPDADLKRLANINAIDVPCPNTIKQAKRSKYWPYWKVAIEKEIKSLMKFQVFDLTKVKGKQRTVGTRWVFKVKPTEDGKVFKFKARLVAQGFLQREGIDFSETFSPVARYETIRFMLALTAKLDLECHTMDVNTAFLNGKLEERIFVKNEMIADGRTVRLKRSLYGLRQSPRTFNKDFHSKLLQLGLKQSKADPCLYYLCTSNRMVLVGIFVDDALVCTKGKADLLKFKKALNEMYEMTDNGPITSFLGMEIERNRKLKNLNLTQKRYVADALTKFNMNDCNPVSTPMDSNSTISKDDSPKTQSDHDFMKDKPYRSIIGVLLYAAISTRPDIQYAVSYLSRYLACPGPAHWKAAKRILRYLKGTKDMGIRYSGSNSIYGQDMHLHGYVDASFGDDIDTRRSTSGFLFYLANGPISWMSKRQPTVAGSTAEAEYYGAYFACQEAMWLLKFVHELQLPVQVPLILHEDNQAAIRISKNPENHKRAKHIDIKYHFLKEKVDEGKVSLVYINTKQQRADAMTKALPRVQFQELRKTMVV